MSQLIEKALGRIGEKEQLNEIGARLFETSLSLLIDHGKLKRVGLFSWRQFGQTVELGEAKLRLILSAGSNIKKANKVKIDLEGMPTVEVTKRGGGGRGEFDCRYYGSTGQKLDTQYANDYLDVLEMIREKLQQGK